MNRFAKTFILAGIVALFAMYVIWDFTSELEKAPGEEELIFPIAADFGEITVKNPQGTVKMLFADGKCRIVEPVQDLCDSSSSESLKDQLRAIRGRPLEELAPLDQMGLSEGQGSEISFLLKDGKIHGLRIGEKSTFDGKFYVKVGEKVFIADAAVAQLTNKGLRQFQDAKLWRADFSKDQIESVDVTVDYDGTDESYSLKKAGDVWSLTQPTDEREISSPAVQAWLVAVIDARGQEVKMEKMPEVGKPIFRIVFHGPSGATYEMRVASKDKGGFFWAADSAHPRMLKLSGEVLGQMTLPYWALFDGKKSFQFSLEQAAELIVTKNGQKDFFKKSDEKWAYEGKKEEFNEEQLPEFFSKLRQLEAQTYLKPQKWFGLSDKNQLRVLKSDGGELLSFTWGDKFKPQQGPKKGMDLRYVQIQGQKYVFGVQSQQLDELLNMNLFGKNKKSEPHEHVH